MSKSTQSRIFKLYLDKTCLGLSALLLPCLGSLSHADELDDLQRDREQSHMEYIREVRTGKYKDPQKREELRKRLIDGPEQKFKEFAERSSKPLAPRKVSDADMDLSKARKADVSALKEGGAPGEPEIQDGAKRIPNPSSGDKNAGKRPEYVLDGSSVPKEISFEKESKNEAKTADSPTPTKVSKPATQPSANPRLQKVDPKDLQRMISPD